MQYAYAVAAQVGSSQLITSISQQFLYKLTEADVMSLKPKSCLQQLWERLLQVVALESKP